MSKRKCPFDGEYNTNPVKKQITDEKGTVAMVSQMKMIYDRTMRMLFEGSKAVKVSYPANEAQHEVMETDASRYRQTFLDSRCQLRPNNTAVGQSGAPRNPFGTETSIVCSFCDKRLMNGCSKECSKCGEAFCRMCSSERFNNFSDQFVCLGCA